MVVPRGASNATPLPAAPPAAAIVLASSGFILNGRDARRPANRPIWIPGVSGPRGQPVESTTPVPRTFTGSDH